MYSIERKPYGFKLVFRDVIEIEEMKKWVDDARKVLTDQEGKFGVLVDMRTLKPLKSDVQAAMVTGQRGFKEKGMERSAVGVANAIIAMQFKRLAQESGIYQWERYIDASKDSQWEDTAESWVRFAKDPDK